MIYVLDTHILIWYFIGSARLHKSFKEKIDGVRNQEGKLLIPTIVLAEALNIAEKGKVKFDFHKMYKIIQEEPAFEIIGYGFEIFNASLKINGIKEIHDRIIVATAKFYQVNLLTKDRIINASGEIETSL